MATIKSYTDISQSKKLAEILPFDSADMEYLALKENGALIGAVPFVKDDSEVEDSAYNYAYDRITCWSLAALLSILPQSVRLVGTPKDSYWYCEGVDNNNQWYAGSASANNPVDACYEMIIKLSELNLL